MSVPSMIGVLGGVGPMSGTYFHQHIIRLTDVKRDQDHISVIHFSLPKYIDDRTAYLFKIGDDSHQFSIERMDSLSSVMEENKSEKDENPGIQMAKLAKLIQQNAQSLGHQMLVCVPCNTFHSPMIFTPFSEEINKMNRSLKGSKVGHLTLLNMIELTLNEIESKYLTHATNRNVGLLSTTGTRMTKVYDNVALQNANNLTIKYVSDEDQNHLHDAIYNNLDGIKTLSKATPRVRALLESHIKQLKNDHKCDIVILGCTELPIALPEKQIFDVVLIDPMVVMAKHAIGAVQTHELVIELSKQFESRNNSFHIEAGSSQGAITSTAHTVLEMTTISPALDQEEHKEKEKEKEGGPVSQVIIGNIKALQEDLAINSGKLQFRVIGVIAILALYSTIMCTYLFFAS